MRGCIPQQPFSKMLLMNTIFPQLRTFTITIYIYVLCPNSRIIKMYEQNASCLVKHSDLGAKNLKICLKIVQKVTKWPLQYVSIQFQTCSGGACPQTPLKPFLFSTCFEIILPEKQRFKTSCVKNWCPLPEKNLEYAAGMKTFFKRLFTSFLGLTSLYLVNIQPNSKFHPPTKISGSIPECEIEFF